MNHPVLCLAYKITNGKHSVVYTGDNEPYNFYHIYSPITRRSIQGDINKEDQNHYAEELLKFLDSTDMLFADTQYTDEEYKAKIGWGHSPLSYVLDITKKSKVKHLVMFHHEPTRSDKELDEMLAKAKSLISSNGHSLQISLAREGTTLSIVSIQPL